MECTYDYNEIITLLWCTPRCNRCMFYYYHIIVVNLAGKRSMPGRLMIRLFSVGIFSVFLLFCELVPSSKMNIQKN